MSNILEFKLRPKQVKKKGETLCRNNHHKWKVLTQNRFDTQQGKLVTVERCERCGKTRNRLL